MSKAKANKSKPHRRERRRWVPRAHRRRNAFKCCPDCGKQLEKQNRRALAAHRVHCVQYKQHRAESQEQTAKLILGLLAAVFFVLCDDDQRGRIAELYSKYVGGRPTDEKARGEVEELERLYKK